MSDDQAIEKIIRWRSDPVAFVREVFNIEPELWQQVVLDDMPNALRQSIRSGHGVGKSALLSWTILWFLTTHGNVKVPCTAPTAHQLQDILWAEVVKWLRRAPKWFQVQFSIKSDKIEVSADSWAAARTARKENPEALQGFHADNLLFVIDEASGVEEVIFEVASGALSTKGARVIMTGNPTRTSGYFYDSFHKMRHVWTNYHVRCQDSQQVDAAFIDEMKIKYGEDSDVYRVRVLGDFPTMDQDAVIPISLIEAAYARDVKPVTRVMPVWGLDVARFGNNKTALVRRQSNAVTQVQKWYKRDTMEVAGLVMAEYESCDSDQRPAVICVDSIGVGAGVADRLRELGLPVNAVNVGEAPSGVGRYLNLRAELWWRAREWLEERDTLLVNEELGAELSMVKFQITSSGKIKIEGKEEMIERGVESPDLADAFVLTFAGAERRKEHGRYDRRPGRHEQSAWAA